LLLTDNNNDKSDDGDIDNQQLNGISIVTLRFYVNVCLLTWQCATLKSFEM
ncbi:unnamed protein product, partial [Ceratitis capitata]